MIYIYRNFVIFIYVSESVSRDSGVGFEAGGVDILSNGLNSMGLGGRGFPSYGNQGFVNITDWNHL